MKKILFCAAIVAAMLFTACGTKSEKTEANQKLQEFVDQLNAKAAEEGETDYTVSLRGNDIVVSGEVDESDLPGGMSVKNLMDMLNAGGDNMMKQMLDETDMFNDAEGREMAQALRENKSNIIMQFTGKQSGEVGELVIRYDLLPE
jgi:hypothetical protein